MKIKVLAANRYIRTLPDVSGPARSKVWPWFCVGSISSDRGTRDKDAKKLRD